MKKILFLFGGLLLITSCDDIIEVEDISNQTVVVLAPADGAIVTSATVNFSWDAVVDAEKYRIQIAEPTFMEATQIVIDSTVISTNVSFELSAENYEWRVRAENSDYNTAYITQGFSLETAAPVDISNETVVLLAPGDAVVFSATDTINFSWETIENADRYTLQIAQPDFQNAIEIIEEVSQTGNTFSVSNLEVNTYEWRVKAENSVYETAFTTQSFSVE